MKVRILPFIILSGLTLPAAAQDIGGSPTGNGSIVVAPTTQESCVDVQIGSEHAFNCLNEKLKQEADEVNPVLNIAPIDAGSPDTRVGTVNVPAVRQQYGRNFGISVVPYRPPPLDFGGPLRGR